MRIQHNIMAMNSYRNYTNNTSALAKNLEKLSSGYKINRAGDDAAGLAISEKMRAQITGLKTAQKNAKDGISLVQTAEGALTEVHDMLNRMVELADQSANGTYDNEVDRANLQKEFDALRTEIDRIADSSNFNGIKLLDGSLAGKGATAGGVDGMAAAYVGGAGALGDGAAVAGVYDASLKLVKAADTENVIDATTNDTGGIVKLHLTADDGSSYDLKLAFGAGDVTGAQFKAALKAQLEGPTDEFKALNPDWESFSEKFNVSVTNTANAESKITFTSKAAGSGQPKITGLTATFHKLDAVTGDYVDTVATTGEADTGFKVGTGTVAGTVTTNTAATDAYKKITFADTNDGLKGKTVTIGDNTYQFVNADELGKVADGNKAVVLGADKAETMANLVARLKDDGVSTASVYNTGTDTVVRIGNLDEIKVSNKQSVSASSESKGVALGNDTAVDAVYTVTVAAAADEAQTLTFNYTDKDGKAQSYTLNMTAADIKAANSANVGTMPTAGAQASNVLASFINKDETLKELFSASVNGANLALTAKDDKNGVTLSSLTAKGAASNNFLGATALGNTVNVSSAATGAANINGTTAYGAGQTIVLDNNKLKSGDTLEVNGKTYQFLNSGDLDKLKDGATAVIIGANSNATADNLKVALANDGITSKNPAAGKLLIENDMKVSVSGGLTLQIGESAEDFNQLTVSVNDMHAKALGLADISIDEQANAKAAVDVIKKAINSVSSTRGDLGATQNRLEHTINNLSVMQENIQDAESNIRDVDVAEEMMDYTKNNILVQSAQAMLAQANQVPQGVLQLLQ